MDWVDDFVCYPENIGTKQSRKDFRQRENGGKPALSREPLVQRKAPRRSAWGSWSFFCSEPSKQVDPPPPSPFSRSSWRASTIACRCIQPKPGPASSHRVGLTKSRVQKNGWVKHVCCFAAKCHTASQQHHKDCLRMALLGYCGGFVRLGQNVNITLLLHGVPRPCRGHPYRGGISLCTNEPTAAWYVVAVVMSHEHGRRAASAVCGGQTIRRRLNHAFELGVARCILRLGVKAWSSGILAKSVRQISGLVWREGLSSKSDQLYTCIIITRWALWRCGSNGETGAKP